MDAKLAAGVAVVTPGAEPLYVVESVGFEDVYRREYPALFAVAAALTGGLSEADDLVQDTMVKALVHWRRVRRLERPGGWCHRVLVNACRNWARRRRVEARFRSRQSRTERYVNGPSGEAVAFCHAVHRLPTRPRSVVALYYLGEHSVAEVASILGVPQGTVRSDLSRARGVLRNELGV